MDNNVLLNHFTSRDVSCNAKIIKSWGLASAIENMRKKVENLYKNDKLGMLAWK